MRGQLALEFIIMVAFAVIMGTVFLAASTTLFLEEGDRQRVAALNDIGYMLQDELILATAVEDGYSRSIDVPEKAGRFSYTISTTAEAITLTSGATAITYPIPQIIGTIQKGENTILKAGAVAVIQ